MKIRAHRVLIALIFALAVTAGGCSVLSPQPDRSRFFVLVPSPDPHNLATAAALGNKPNFTIGLGPITIPGYLQRPQVVTRVSETELAVSDNDRWAEPLDTCVPSVLAQDLSTDLPGSQIVPFPWPEKGGISYRVSVEFLHLERTVDGKADVEAIWKIRGPGDKLLQSGATTAKLPGGNDQTSTSAALSEGIGQISREIAQALTRRYQVETYGSKRTQS
jgi:uncharacterized lipoprotein YmbA